MHVCVCECVCVCHVCVCVCMGGCGCGDVHSRDRVFCNTLCVQMCYEGKLACGCVTGKVSLSVWVCQMSGVSVCPHRLVGLVVGRLPRERKVPGSNPACAGIFSGPSHTSDLEIGTPVATLPGARHYRVNAGTGRPSISIL